jgi:hypothetical protein
VGEEVEIIEGPITALNLQGLEESFFKIRHINIHRKLHEGWIAASAILQTPGESEP